MAELPILGVDLDDTVGDFLGGFLPWGRQRYPNTTYNFSLPTPEEAERHSFALSVAYGPPPLPEGDWGEIITRYEVESSLDTMKPFEGAIDALGRLSVHFEIHIVTSRPRVARTVTQQWLERYIPEGIITELHMPTEEKKNPMATDKGKYCRALGMFAVVDDGDHNVIQVSDAGLLAISFGNIYHNFTKGDKLPNNAEKAYNWEEVEGILIPHAK